jgi:hypothetical protein
VAEWHHTRAALAAEYRWARERGEEPDPELLETLLLRLRAQKAEADITRLVASAPPLSDEQVARLRALLPRARDTSEGADAHAA